MLGRGLHQAGLIFFIPLPERSVVRSNLTGNLVKLRRVVHPPAVKNAWTCQTPDFWEYCVFIPRYTLFLKNAEYFTVQNRAWHIHKYECTRIPVIARISSCNRGLPRDHTKLHDTPSKQRPSRAPVLLLYDWPFSSRPPSHPFHI